MTVTTAGVYEFHFSVTASAVNQFAIAVNGTPSASSIYGVGAILAQNDGRTILQVPAGATISLVNFTSVAPVVLPINTGGLQSNVNASLLIRRIA